MDIHPFKELFFILTQISQLNFEVWNDKGRVFSSKPEGTDISIYRQIEGFSAQVMSQAVFCHACFNGQQKIFGVPIRSEDNIIGALLACSTKVNKRLKQKAIDSRKMPSVKETETLLIRLATMMEEKWLDVKEREKIAEELSRSFEDIHLYSRIGNQIKSLIYSQSMQVNLIKEILNTMRVDLAFIKMPEHAENSVFIEKKPRLAKIPDPKPFIESLINAISHDAITLEENYWLLVNSHANTAFRGLSDKPFRFLAVKIQHQDKFYGWLGVVSFYMKETFRRSEMRLLASMAEQLAIVITNTKLYRDLEEFINNIIKSLVNAVEAKDIYTRGHSERVSNLCMFIADHITLGKDQRNILHWASILHDVGKIGVPESILNKKEPLDDEEYEIIKKHPESGYNILQPILQLKSAPTIILHHHERYDGRGYPHGLEGEEIPLLARIIAVADTFDALTSNRAYRLAKGTKEAMAILDDVSGIQLDPHLVSVFKEAYQNNVGVLNEEQFIHVGVSV